MTCSHFFGSRAGFDEFVRLADTGYNLLSDLLSVKKEGKAPANALIDLEDPYDATDWDLSNGYLDWLLALHATAMVCHTSRLRDHVGFWGHSEAVNADMIEELVEMYSATPDPFPLHPLTVSLQLNVVSCSAEAIRIWIDPYDAEIVPVNRGIADSPIYLPESEKDDAALETERAEVHSTVCVAPRRDHETQAIRIVPQSELANTASETHGGAKLVLSDFSALYKGKTCFLGNKKPFAVLEQLNRQLGGYVSLKTLRQEIWGDDLIHDESIQKQVSILGQQLRKAGMDGIEIDGTQKGHYKLVLT
jgi:hypothetical protein